MGDELVEFIKNLKFSKHAKDKLELFEIKEKDLIESLRKPKYICEDNERNSVVYVLYIGEMLFSVVVKENTVITIYRTDEKKLYSRIRSGRWNCY